MIQTVVKRDGRIVGFNEQKIMAAIRKAMLHTDKGEDERLLYQITDRIAQRGESQMTVEEIQDLVEMELMKSSRKDVAQKYIAYRNQRSIARKAKTRDVFLDIVNIKNNDVTRENANMNADTPAGMMTTVLMKHMKKLAHKGFKCFIWDTFKNDDVSNGNDEWLQLLKNSRRVFNLVSKLNVSMVMTFQQALHTTNQRYLDASCLAGSKQVKEVVSELIMMRRLWSDEYTGEKNDCRAWTWDKENQKRDYLTLDSEKRYIVVFINKTRNDEDANQILYRWDAQWNKWTEMGYCTIKNDHRGS